MRNPKSINKWHMLNFTEFPSAAQMFAIGTTLGNLESDFTNGCNSSSELSYEFLASLDLNYTNM